MSTAYVATNFATTTLAADITTTVQTAITLTSGAAWPSPTGGEYTLCALAKPDGTRELACIVGRSGNVLTVGIPGSAAANAAGRAYEGTTATTWVSGNAASCVASAAINVAALAHIADAADAHAASAITNTPAGNVAATTVQAAIDELDAQDSALDAAKFAKAGGVLSGAVDVARATVASHATTAPIWAAAGNQIDYTGVAVATAFPDATQAGAERVLICAAACGFTAGANMLIEGVSSGATLTAAANDEVIVRAVSTTQFRLSIKKYDGTAVVQAVPAGTLIDFAGSSAPSGYLACNGAAVSRTTYLALFTAIGTLWGVGNGTTTFNVPNFAAGDAAVQTAGTVGASTDGDYPAHTHTAGFSDSGNAASAVTSSVPSTRMEVKTGSGYYTGSSGTGTRNFAAGKRVFKCIKT